MRNIIQYILSETYCANPGFCFNTRRPKRYTNIAHTDCSLKNGLLGYRARSASKSASCVIPAPISCSGLSAPRGSTGRILTLADKALWSAPNLLGPFHGSTYSSRGGLGASVRPNRKARAEQNRYRGARCEVFAGSVACNCGDV